MSEQSEDVAQWHIFCQDCDHEENWSKESLARDSAAIHERNHGHSVEIRDLFDTAHRLPESLRSGGLEDE